MKNQIITKKLKYALGLVLLFGAMSCSDELTDLSPSETNYAKGGPIVAPPPAFVFTLPTFDSACVLDESYCFDAFFKNKGGNDPGGNNSITVTIAAVTGDITNLSPANDQVEASNSGNFCFSGLTAGTYTVVVYFRHAANDNAQAVNVPLSFTLTVQSAENCGDSTTCSEDGVSLTRSVSNVETDTNGIVTSLQANYIVKNCGEVDLTRLKLQGGLINKASIIGTSTATGDAENVVYTPKTTRGNTTLSWTFNLPAGAEETFSVYYNVWGVSCGSPLSGAWSLKNSAGTPIGVAPEDESAISDGYLDRLYWNCL